MEVVLVQHDDQVRHMVNHIWDLCALFPFLAVDCEWVVQNKKRRRISLLQIATEYKVFLFRLHLLDCSSWAAISTLLQTKNIIKVGVGIKTDAEFLWDDYRIFMHNWLDLRFLSGLVGPIILPPRSLAIMAQQTLGIMMDKDKTICCSDWNAGQLSEKQLKYAAADVRVPILLLKKVIDIVTQKYNLDSMNLSSFVHIIECDTNSDFIYRKGIFT